MLGAAGLLSFIQQSGIMLTDRRIAHSMKRIRECVQQGGSLSLHNFTDIIRWAGCSDVPAQSTSRSVWDPCARYSSRPRTQGG